MTIKEKRLISPSKLRGMLQDIDEQAGNKAHNYSRALDIGFNVIGINSDKVSRFLEVQKAFNGGVSCEISCTMSFRDIACGCCSGYFNCDMYNVAVAYLLSDFCSVEEYHAVMSYLSGNVAEECIA